MLCGFIFLISFSADLLAIGSPPAPKLIQVQDSGSALVLRCQAPSGHKGRQFKLYQRRELVDTVQWDKEQINAEFKLHDLVQENHYCCQYDNSMISPYTTIRALPPGPIRPLAPPHLSVTPSVGRVVPGQVMHFHCQAPPTSGGPLSMTFILRRRPWKANLDQDVSQSSDPRFKVGPVSQGDGGIYTCLYQLMVSEGIQNSDISSPVAINITAPLPPPQLFRDDEGLLVCTGSPSYPGAHFSLYQLGAEVPLVTQHASMVQHSAQFAMPEVNGQTVGGYQCQYSMLLGGEWAHSERSAAITLPCPTGSSSCSSSPTGYIPPLKAEDRVDLALIIGSVSAALLFMLVLIIVGFAVAKHAKSAAEKRRKREQDALWHQVRSRDHIDLTLQRVNFSPLDHIADGNGRISVSEPIYDYPFTTFSNPSDK